MNTNFFENNTQFLDKIINNIVSLNNLYNQFMEGLSMLKCILYKFN